jgi:hypothetical protein
VQTKVQTRHHRTPPKETNAREAVPRAEHPQRQATKSSRPSAATESRDCPTSPRFPSARACSHTSHTQATQTTETRTPTPGKRDACSLCEQSCARGWYAAVHKRMAAYGREVLVATASP